ncbi:MAG TPA: response regulator [Humidesulfovibrio sp.]|uniref:sensor histidine kinase n=1 Tax=Humidesulfovibrio sp. TaxID=2910988 RepID=UPI002C7255ED|nr:response regulator [Humidesulfovibrio sp.]HWR03901.1 response regulator [Humidesulfovibrio sp.]
MNAVLLVDDERDFADLLAERLSARGFQVQTAYDGEEALRLAAVHELDVAVLDVNLPGIDGLAVLRELKKLKPQAEALMLTGQMDLATAIMGMKLGATDYLVKPVPIERLTEAILRAQDRREERLEGQRMAETAKMAALGHMAEGVAHEINNPVNTMVSLAGWMEDLAQELREAQATGSANVSQASPDNTLAEMLASARKMREHGQRVKEITAKLLCLCHKAEPRELSATSEAVGSGALLDLGRLLERLVDERRGRLEDCGVNLSPALSPDLPSLALPPSGLPGADLGTAIGNILDNALDAMPGGGQLWLIASAHGHEVHIEVEDTGQGILPAHLPRVFEPFFSTKDVGQGTGLGLSVSYGTVKALGGDIDITSQPGQGTKVLISLPC